MKTALDDIYVVLCRPELPENVGAACRAMQSMGITRLRLVGARELDLGRAAVTAVHAADLLRGLALHDSLEDAVGDAALVAGVTRRAGRWRKYFQLTPEDLADRIAERATAPVAVVFGNEADGLDDEELGCCHVAVRIPSSPLFPSLNLSHAVQLVTYALYRRLAGSEAAAPRPVSTRRIEGICLTAADALREAGFFTQTPDAEMRVFLRDILARSAMAEAEADRLESIFSRLRDMVGHLRRSRVP